MGKKKGRGSGTGRGSSKKGRGAGNRGGRGNTGYGKKSGHKKQSVPADHLGSDGFTRPQGLSEDADTINLKDIDQHIEAFVEEGAAEEEGGGYVFDAAAAGYDKVLGGGQLYGDIDIRADEFSADARRKIEESGNEALEEE